MILKCTNNDCGKEREEKNFKIKIDSKGNSIQDDSICDECGSRMIDRDTQYLDYSNVRIEKPFSDRSKNYYKRRNISKL